MRASWHSAVPWGEERFSWVDVDGAAGVCDAVDYLIGLGHRRIAYLGTQRAFSFSHFRHEGYLHALLRANVPYDEDLVVQDLDATSDLEMLIDRLLCLNSPPTALIVCAELLASGVLRVLRRRELRIPRDLSVVAFDDSPITRYEDPPTDEHPSGCAGAWCTGSRFADSAAWRR